MTEMHLGSVYLIVNDYEKSISFYEKLLEIPLTSENNGRFATFEFDGQRIAIMNGHFDIENPDKVERKGKTSDSAADLQAIALAPNTHKFVFNFWIEDLRSEYERVKALNISENLSDINYFKYVTPYYYFQLTDPDGNIIEVTGSYTPEDGEFD